MTWFQQYLVRNISKGINLPSVDRKWDFIVSIILAQMEKLKC